MVEPLAGAGLLPERTGAVSPAFDVINIGCLSRNRFWNEQQAKRAAHATCVLIRDESNTVLVDPSLPTELLNHRLDERAGLAADDIDCVFLTCFRPVHRRGLSLFDRADWLMGGGEIEAMRTHLEALTESARQRGEADDPLVREELALLQRIRPAPDRITRSVHLFPAAGATPGTCGLLLARATATVVVAGDAVVSRDHYEHGQVLEQCFDLAQARTSLTELAEVADQVIPGHDNLFVPVSTY